MPDPTSRSALEDLYRLGGLITDPPVAREEDRRPIILIKDMPMTDVEGQALADAIRRVTKYPVIVLDSHWSVW